MEAEFSHLPVMVREVVELLLPVPAGLIVDCTVGGAGHAAALLDARPDLRLLGIDRDADAVAAARLRLAPFGDSSAGGRREDSSSSPSWSTEHGEGEQVMGILMDLGVSSPQLDRPERGFSYRFDAPLDMRMDAKQALTAADVVNGYDVDELADVIARNGEERFARRIARAHRRGPAAAHDARARRRSIRDAIPAPHPARGVHTRRGARSRPSAWRSTASCRTSPTGSTIRCTSSGRKGRVLVLAYHSLEDRMVKETFARWAGEDDDSAPALPKLPVEPTRRPLVRLLTRRPLRPRADEVAANRRAESVRLRAVERARPRRGAVERSSATFPMSTVGPRLRCPSPRSPTTRAGAAPQRAHAARLRVAPRVARRRRRRASSRCGRRGVLRRVDVPARRVPRVRGAVGVPARQARRAARRRGAQYERLRDGSRRVVADAIVAAARAARHGAPGEVRRLHRRARGRAATRPAPDRTPSTPVTPTTEAKPSLGP